MGHTDVEELVSAARNRDKADIGLPPGLNDTSAAVTWIIGTASQFKQSPVDFETILPINTVIDLPVANTQTVGIIRDRIVVRIVVPETPGWLERVDEIRLGLRGAVVVGTWLLNSNIRKIVRTQIFLEIRKLRLERANKVLAAEGISDTTRFKALLRSSKIQRGISKGSIKQAGLILKAKAPLRVGGRIVLRAVTRPLIIIGIALDVVFITLEVAQGAQRAGLAGAVGGLAKGIADAATLGLLEDQTTALGLSVEKNLLAITSSEFIRTADPKTLSFGFGGIG